MVIEVTEHPNFDKKESDFRVKKQHEEDEHRKQEWKKQKETRDAKLPEYNTSMYKLHEGKKVTLYEQLANGEFAWYDAEKNKIKFSGGIATPERIVLPLDNKITQKNAIPLPSDAIEYGSTLNLIADIDEHIKKYCDLPPAFRKLGTWFILMTWIKDNLTSINYLRFLGDYGSGKTRAWKAFGRLCYKPIMLGASHRVAPLYRLQDIWQGTMCLDECVLRDSDEGSDIIQVLNAGIEKGSYVPRCDQDNDVDLFDAFGPKVISSRTGFMDNATESRCITNKMKKTGRKDIPTTLPSQFYLEEEVLRNKLLMFRFRNWQQVNADNILEANLPETDGRLQQMMAPFAVTFHEFPKIIEDLNTFMIDYYARQVDHASQTIDGGIVKAILEMFVDCEIQITSSDILKKMKDLGYETGLLKDNTIGKKRRGLGIEAKQRTIKDKKGKSTSKMSLVWDAERMESLMKQYIPMNERKKYEHLFVKNKDNSGNLNGDW